MKILHVVGARPNFMKAAPPPVPPNPSTPLRASFGGLGGREMAKYPQEFEQLLVHTGQHYGNGTLLKQHVKGVLRGAGAAPAGHLPGRGLQQPRAADGPHHAGL